MKLIKTAGLAACAVLIIAVLAGCRQPAKSPSVSPDNTPPASESARPASSGLNITGAAAAFDPKEVMLTVNGKDITWDELFYYINQSIEHIAANGGQINNWSAAYQNGTTYKDYVLNAAVDMVLRNSAIEYGAAQNKVSLTTKDQEEIQAAWAARAESAGGEEAFIAQLEAEYCSKEIYMYLERVSYLAQKCLNAMYGEKGYKLSDRDVSDYTAGDGYLMAKHILMLTKKTDETGNETEMTAAEKARVKDKIEGILDQLKAYDGNDFDGYFDQLMHEHSADKGGLAYYPDGYLFQEGDMVHQFYDGTMALQIGEFSKELVETAYGYHIIYRIPINYDVTPIRLSDYGEFPLRYFTAVNMFTSDIDAWQAELDVIYSETYKSLDFDKIFAAG